MSLTLNSNKITNGIRVRVSPSYLPEHSDPDQKQFIFGYRIVITNESDNWVKLINRHWIIINADGKDVLNEIEGVQRIEERSINDGRIHYVVDVSHDCASDISEAIHRAGLKLYLLQPERRTLESVFSAVNEPQQEL